MNKLLLVIPTLKQGGAERVMSELATIWAEQGHEVHLVLLARAEAFYAVDPRVRVHHLEFENTGKIGKVLGEVRTLRSLRRTIKTVRPDFVLSFMEKYNVLTLLASRGLGVPVFVSDRSNPLKKIPSWVDFLRRKTYRWADGIISQTSLSKEVLAKNTGQTNIRVIPNPVRQVVVTPVAKEPLIVNVGRLTHEKGQSYLLEAFARLDAPHWKLAILGEGPLRTSLQAAVRRLGIEGRVLLPGSVADVDGWLSRASIFAFPSVSEGFPNALVEAMAAGLPCVAFDCNAGPRDILHDGENGFLVEQGDVETLTGRLAALVADPQLRERLGAQATQTASAFEGAKIAGHYLAFGLTK